MTLSGLIQRRVARHMSTWQIDVFATAASLVVLNAITLLWWDMPMVFSPWNFWALTIASFLPLLFARWAPVIAVVAVWVVVLVIFENGQPLYLSSVPMACFYGARFGMFRQSVTVLGICFAIEGYYQVTGWNGPTVLLVATMVPLTGWLLGDRSRLHAERQRLNEQQLENLRTEQSSREREAVTSERLHIARELHDIVSHSLSAIVLHAGGAQRFVDPDELEVKQALDTIEAIGRQDLGEIRGFLSNLRSRDAAGAEDSIRTIDDLDELVNRCETNGLAVDLEIDGDVADLTPRVGMAAYRVIQESLTNTIRHSSSESSTIRVAAANQQLTVEVIDEGTPDQRSPQGLGLIGMRERVESLAGTFAAEPTAQGFRVHASIPILRDEAAHGV